MLKSLSRIFSSSNPYKVLGIPENSSKDQIKLAYYRIAKKYHPDINSHYPVLFTKEYFAAATNAYKELESHNFKYQVSTKTEPTERLAKNYHQRKFKSDIDNKKKNLALIELLVVLGLAVVVIFKLILVASAKRKEQLMNQQNEYLIEAGLEKVYDEEEQVIRFVPKS